MPPTVIVGWIAVVEPYCNADIVAGGRADANTLKSCKVIGVASLVSVYLPM